MGGVPGSLQVRSLSKAGLSQVVVVFEDDTDIYFARQQIFERLQAAREHLPPLSSRSLGPSARALARFFSTPWKAKDCPMELRPFRIYDHPQLKPIPGVNEVNSFGGFVHQYQVLVNQEALLKYGI